MRLRYVAALLVMVVGAAARAEMAETPEAEAARRHVPLIQVQDERALADEKQKQADLEKKLDGLNKELADAQAAQSVSSLPADPAQLYDELMKRYLAGQWETLPADIKAKEKEIATLPAEKIANLAYVKQAVEEGRPAWWQQIKSGTGVQPFKATLWKQEVNAVYASGPGRIPAPAQAVSVQWPRAQMDSLDSMSLSEVGLSLGGNFHKGDGVDQLAWSYLAMGCLYQTAGAEKIKGLSGEQKTALDNYGGFLMGVTTGYYGTPQARRLVIVEALASFEEMNNDRPEWLGKRPIGSAILLEMSLNAGVHKTVRPIAVLGLDKAGIEVRENEEFRAKPLILGMVGSRLTFEEDKAFREMFKFLGEKNQDWQNTRIALPWDMAYDLDIPKDAPLGKERMKKLGG